VKPYRDHEVQHADRLLPAFRLDLDGLEDQVHPHARDAPAAQPGQELDAGIQVDDAVEARRVDLEDAQVGDAVDEDLQARHALAAGLAVAGPVLQAEGALLGAEALDLLDAVAVVPAGPLAVALALESGGLAVELVPLGENLVGVVVAEGDADPRGPLAVQVVEEGLVLRVLEVGDEVLRGLRVLLAAAGGFDHLAQADMPAPADAPDVGQVLDGHCGNLSVVLPLGQRGIGCY
jgi:hypothetical protein